jgi:hypothetical protein
MRKLPFVVYIVQYQCFIEFCAVRHSQGLFFWPNLYPWEALEIAK